MADEIALETFDAERVMTMAQVEMFAETAALALAHSIGKRMVGTFQAAIRKQLPGWEPHAPATIARKLREGSNFPSDVWRDVGILIEQIEYRVVDEPDGFEVQVGIWSPRDRVIAAWVLEFGNDRVVARPLFRPEFERILPDLFKVVEVTLNRWLDDIESGRAG